MKYLVGGQMVTDDFTPMEFNFDDLLNFGDLNLNFSVDNFLATQPPQKEKTNMNKTDEAKPQTGEPATLTKEERIEKYFSVRCGHKLFDIGGFCKSIFKILNVIFI